VEIPHYLTQIGFLDVGVFQEQADFVYADAQQWWNARWTHGHRYAFEHIEPSVLAQFQAEVFAKLTQEALSGSIHETLNIQYILAKKGTGNQVLPLKCLRTFYVLKRICLGT
jgi:hypothetical protein